MTDTRTTPLEERIAKVDDELAVGEDLAFQRKWWTFERWVWRFFALLVLCDLLGLFGRGPLAHAHTGTQDGVLTVRYDRVERFSTPSILSVRFGPQAVVDGQVHLLVSESLVQRLGNQRISPEPASTVTSAAGLLYAFPSQPSGGEVQFALQPAHIGTSRLTLSLPDAHGSAAAPVHVSIFVMP